MSDEERESQVPPVPPDEFGDEDVDPFESASDTADPDKVPGEAAPEGKEDLFGALVGQVIGNCLIDGKLGEGGMGVVFRAAHRLLNRRVALKVLPKAFKPNQDKVRRFFQEAASLGAIRSPNIVQVFNVGEEPGFYFIEMEYVEGGTLEHFIAEHAPVPAGDALLLMKQIASGLAAAHAISIIHRDIKPGNVLMDLDGTPKLADFGLAKNLETSSNVTRDGAMMGTPHFMSPEQCRGDPVSKQSDIYSLGAVFYMILTGRMPFESENPMAVVLMHMNREVRPPDSIVKGIPKSYSNLVEKMMAKDPAERYEDGAGVLAALEGIEKGVQVEYTARRIRRRRYRMIAATAALAVMAATGVFGGMKYVEWTVERDRILSGVTRETAPEAARRIYTEGVSLYESGEFSAAAAKIREAMRTWARFTDDQGYLARADALSTAREALFAGEPAAALSAADAAGAVTGDRNFDELRAAARMLLDSENRISTGDFAGALQVATGLRSRMPALGPAAAAANFAAAALEAESLRASGDIVAALAKAEALAASRPSNAPAAALKDELATSIKTQVLTLISAKDLDHAVMLAERAARAAPSSNHAGEALRSANLAAASFGSLAAEADRKLLESDFAGAARLYEKALETGSSAEIEARLREARFKELVSAGRELLTAGSFDESEKRFAEAGRYSDDMSVTQALIRDARRANAIFILARANRLVRSNMLDEAARSLAQAVEVFAEAGSIPLYENVKTEISRREAVPEGFVYLPSNPYPVSAGSQPRRAQLGPLYVQAREVTNREFAQFVAAGGYSRDELWDAEALPLRKSFLDRNETSMAPGSWIDGACPSGQEDMPVSSVSMFEAAAYARFMGGRLPTADEWTAAATHAPGEQEPRPFPWGGMWRPDAANVMAGRKSSSPRPAGSFPLDSSALGCLDMAGNVSEWTSTPKKGRQGYVVIKGGSFRHTRESQVSSLGEESSVNALTRWPIIGFRMVMDVGGGG